MPSANPDAQSDYESSRAEQTRATKGQNRSRDTSSLGHSPEVQQCTSRKEHEAKEEHYWKWQNRIQALLTLFTFCAFVAAGVYARYAKEQVEDARQREAIELRAYVSVGTPQGQTVELIQPFGGKATIKVHFINSGKTPARHFSIRTWSSLKSFQGPPFFRSRWRGWGQLTNPGLEGQDATLGSESPYVETVKEEFTPTPDYLIKLKEAAVKNDPNGPHFMLFGIFEYCDVFGRHHCDDFSYRYLADTDRWESSPAMPLCNMFTMLKEKPPEPVTFEGVVRPWKELPHCEQPDEVPEQ